MLLNDIFIVSIFFILYIKMKTLYLYHSLSNLSIYANGSRFRSILLQNCTNFLYYISIKILRKFGNATKTKITQKIVYLQIFLSNPCFQAQNVCLTLWLSIFYYQRQKFIKICNRSRSLFKKLRFLTQILINSLLKIVHQCRGNKIIKKYNANIHVSVF